MAAQPQFQEYPKILHHPNHRPATTRIIPNAPGTPGILKPGSEGTSVFLPDVTVINEDEEAQYRAKGYTPVGEADPTAYARAVAGAPPLGMQIQAYPKWRYHATKEACVVDTPEAERALGDGWADRPDLVQIAAPAPTSSVPPSPSADERPRSAAPGAAPKKAKPRKAKKKAKAHGWTPERRAAQSAAMKARIAAKKDAEQQQASE
jgi:hypothetical protein